MMIISYGSLGHGSWNLRFAHAFNDWELDMVVNLLFGKKRPLSSLTSVLERGKR